MISRHRAILLIAGLLILVVIFPMNGVAASPSQQEPEFALFVTTTEDHNDGFCDGDCSLREAIIAANQSGYHDTILLPSGTYTLILEGKGEQLAATGDLDVRSGLTIIGDGPATTIIDAGGMTGDPDRVLDIDPADSGGYEVNLWGLTITGGDAAGADGGGIRNRGASVTLYGCVVSGNSADRNGGGIHGGSGALNVENSTISENSADDDGGGIYNSSGELDVKNSTISENSADDDGGGIFCQGDLDLKNSTVSGNTALYTGGGIWVDSTFAHVANSTISGNTASIVGGGIYNESGVLDLENSTISGNRVSRWGGGIFNYEGLVHLENGTISGNSADEAGGGIYSMLSLLDLENTIVANNAAGYDCYGTIASNGHNLDSDGTCKLDPAKGDLPNTDPRLGPLQDNGGPTLTHALLFASPAIDAGDNSACPATDQRGFTRPMDGDGDGTATCDIGAFEHLGLMGRFPLMISNAGRSP